MPLVGKNAFFERPAFQRTAKRLAFQSQLRGQHGQHIDPAHVFTALEERAKDRRVVIVEPTLAPRPPRSLMGSSRARLHRRQPQPHPQPLSHRINGAAPHAVKVFAVRVERRDRLWTQLEGAPDDA